MTQVDNEYKPNAPLDSEEDRSKESEKFTVRFKKWWANFIADIKQNWREVLIRYAFFIAVFTILLVIDQVTKNALFENVGDNYRPVGAFERDQKIWGDFGLIGFRSVGHHGVTIFRKGELSNGGFILIHIISVILFLILLVSPLYVKSYFVITFLAGIAAGDIGNFIDRMRFNNTVLDVVYSPFFEEWVGKEIGTFNFADAYIVAAACLFVLRMIFKGLYDSNKEELQEQDMIHELLVDDKVKEEILAEQSENN